MDAEKAQAKAAKALNQAEAKVAKKAAKVKLKGMQVEMKSDIPEEVTLLEESEKKKRKSPAGAGRRCVWGRKIRSESRPPPQSDDDR